jgi:RNA polymerase sigma factor (sigma-70 family)
VNRGSVLAILRQLTVNPPATDAELLGRFTAERDQEAFAEMVRRHGPLVWAVCRHLADSDADDAFQAVFLVLFRNTRKIRNPNNLAAWLHGVAYRVCSKSRQLAKRRATREQAAAVKDQDRSTVADSAWDRAMVAVHEEVVKLPETLRGPFVLCYLEGKSMAAAAEQLGWKLGTLSGRLMRAKNALLARLATRDLMAGALTALACTGATAPAAVVEKAVELVHGGVTVSGTILQLSQGVIGMSAYHVKMLAAAVLLACGLGVGGGAGWLANAEAQPGPTGARVTPEERVRNLEQQLQQARLEMEEAKRHEEARWRAKDLGDWLHAAEGVKAVVFSTAKWDYSFMPVSRMDAAKFAKFLEERESRGWNFSGQVTLDQDGKGSATWVFRRPAKKSLGNQVNPNTGGGFPPGGRSGPPTGYAPPGSNAFPSATTPGPQGTPFPFEKGPDTPSSNGKPYDPDPAPAARGKTGNDPLGSTEGPKK